MEKEIALINELEEKEFSEENLSDTSYEDEDEEKGESACPPLPSDGHINLDLHELEDLPHLPLKRQTTYELITTSSPQDRVRTSNQLALVYLRRIYSQELSDIIRQSEQSVLDLFELISGDILNIHISEIL